MKIRSIAVGAVIPALFTLAGCAGNPSTSAAPDVADDDLDTLTAVTLPGGQTMTANTPVATSGTGYMFNQRVGGSVTFSGPSASIGAGACLLNLVEIQQMDQDRNYYSDTVPCTSESDCTAYQVYTGGHAYCTAPNGGATKYCYVRPGSQADYCVGTPATHANITVPTTLTVPSKDAYGAYYGYWAYYLDNNGSWDWYYPSYDTTWLMYACYGISCSPNSVSSARVWSDGTSSIQN